ncbi:MAG: hypothetical protein LBC19_13120 [Tannerella sp.]|jgi:hypothetical protein|nr:hypothetical protein [Tannerella sp.]
MKTFDKGTNSFSGYEYTKFGRKPVNLRANISYFLNFYISDKGKCDTLANNILNSGYTCNGAKIDLDLLLHQTVHGGDFTVFYTRNDGNGGSEPVFVLILAVGHHITSNRYNIIAADSEVVSRSKTVTKGNGDKSSFLAEGTNDFYL